MTNCKFSARLDGCSKRRHYGMMAAAKSMIADERLFYREEEPE